MSREIHRNAVLTGILAIAIISTFSVAIGAVQYSFLDGLKAAAEKGSDDEDNSGRGRGDRDGSDDEDISDIGGDDRNRRISRLLAASQETSTATTTITIPEDAESHSAANPYTPNPATVSSGATVTWFNGDEEDQHSATADDGSFSTGILNPGQTGKAVINAEPGSTIPYHCDIHPEMIGLLLVDKAVVANTPESNVPGPAGLNSTMLSVSDKPFAIGNYATLSEDIAGNRTLVSVAGNMIIVAPNSTETITANSTGSFALAFTGSGVAIQEGEIHMTTPDGVEEATITLTGFFPAADSTGIGIALFSTDPAGKLALFDNFAAITVYASQPDNLTQIQFFDWQSGGIKDPASNQSASDNSRDDTGTSSQTAAPPAANRSGEVISVSIVQGATSQAGNAFSPSPVQAMVGDTVVWTNDDATPHTVTSGSDGQPDGKFDSSPNLSPLMASGQTFEHTFEDAGEYAYYCQLHPNMVGTVSVG